MAAAASSSSSSGPGWKYGVFLNFKREDTLTGFVSHLDKALRQKSIDTFNHTEKLRKGDRLSEPLTAIRESRLLLVVFSQNYASSTRCLKELVEILQCNGTNKQIMVPIFYQVNPSDVRQPNESFATASARHDTEMDEVRSWRSALTTAADFSGWVSRNFEDDAELIEKIVEDVSLKLTDISPTSSEYDVFINFRGADTRRGFVSHLYKALCQKSISTYIDAKALRKGDPLSKLLTAARESKISIVVLSENYANSTWCLKELLEIWESNGINKHILVPIFYRVNPSDLEEAFAEHGSDSNAEVGVVWSWRSALTMTPSISGWVSGGNDAELIELIVEDISRKLIHISSTSSKDKDLVGMDSHMHERLVGMDSHMREMHFLLYPHPPEVELDDVRVVGLWGRAGLGKTTIARAVYDEIACRFEGHCFLEYVRERFVRHGKLHTQAELLSRISDEKVESSEISKEGFQVMLNSLGQRKVLIVLDDVDALEQIEALLGEQHSFGGGSRIIIITRDERLLRSRADALYRPKIFNNEALEFFSQCAFRSNQPTTNHDDLRRVIHYAQGIPLALKVLGACLYGKRVDERERALGKVRKILQRESHDSLEQMDRELVRQESGLCSYEDIYRALTQNTLKM